MLKIPEPLEIAYERFGRSSASEPDLLGPGSPSRHERRRKYLSAWRAANRERLREYGREVAF